MEMEGTKGGLFPTCLACHPATACASCPALPPPCLLVSLSPCPRVPVSPCPCNYVRCTTYENFTTLQETLCCSNYSMRCKSREGAGLSWIRQGLSRLTAYPPNPCVELAAGKLCYRQRISTHSTHLPHTHPCTKPRGNFIELQSNLTASFSRRARHA